MSLYLTIKLKKKHQNIDLAPVVWMVGTSIARPLINSVYLPEYEGSEDDPEYGSYLILTVDKLAEICDYFHGVVVENCKLLDRLHDDVKLYREAIVHSSSTETYNQACDDYYDALKGVEEAQEDVNYDKIHEQEVQALKNIIELQDDPKEWELVYLLG